MRSLFISLISVLPAVASMTPNTDAQVLILFDGTMQSALMTDIAGDIPAQLRDLAEVYDTSGYNLELAFILSTIEQGVECGWYTNLTDTEAMISNMNDIIAARGDLSTDGKYRRVFNSVLQSVTEIFPAREYGPDTVRRVAMYVSDHSSGWGSATSVEKCSSEPPTPELFGEVMEDARVGFISSLVHYEVYNPMAEAQRARLNETTLTDYLIHDNVYNTNGFHSVDEALMQLLSPEWVATTTTTLAPSTTPEPVNDCLRRAIAECLSCSS